MNPVVVKGYRELSNAAASEVLALLKRKPTASFLLATGHTMKGLYLNLAKEFKLGKADFSKANFFNLDEYLGFGSNSRRSFAHYLQKNFFTKVNASPSRIHLLRGNSSKPALECKRFEKMIREQGIDLAILGIGANGHIAFNEPGSSKNSITRVVSLLDETREANHKYFGSLRKTPRKAFTVGVSTILASKSILLLASGLGKAEAISAAFDVVSSKVPASFLQEHKNFKAIVDQRAASLIEK